MEGEIEDQDYQEKLKSENENEKKDERKKKTLIIGGGEECARRGSGMV